MFCTTFLSAPSEELNCEGSGGGGAVGGGGLGPGSCLSSLHCLVLPQDELYPSASDPTARLSICSKERAHKLVGKMLLDVSMTTCGPRDGGCIWDRVRRRRSRSASPLPSKTPKSPCSESVKGMCFSWGAWQSNGDETDPSFLIEFHVVWLHVFAGVTVTVCPLSVTACWQFTLPCEMTCGYVWVTWVQLIQFWIEFYSLHCCVNTKSGMLSI